MSLLNLRTAYLSSVMLPRDGGIVPKMELLVMSKFCRVLRVPDGGGDGPCQLIVV